jgi:hypothetical protein
MISKETQQLCDRLAKDAIKLDVIYDALFMRMHTWLTKRAKSDPDYFTEDKINRISNIYAVQNTVPVWQLQHSTKFIFNDTKIKKEDV